MATSTMCCCATGGSCDGMLQKGEDGHHYPCLSFVQNEKCCKFMKVCEEKPSGMGAAFDWSKYFKSAADFSLCAGMVSVPPGTKKGPGKIKCPADPKLKRAKELSFFKQLNHKPNQNPALMNRDYTIIVDRSAPMDGMEEVEVPKQMAEQHHRVTPGTQSMSLWQEVEVALSFLAGRCITEDSDGISLIFSGSDVQEISNVGSVDDVLRAFHSIQPSGSTNLAAALQKAVQPDTLGKAETILVITTAQPRSPLAVEAAIAHAAKQLCREEDLTITFVQVGTDRAAKQFLESLDDELQCKHQIFDIVDAVTSGSIQEGGFLNFVMKSVAD